MLLISLELNELNFDSVERYVDAGKLPNFARLFSEFGYVRTASERHNEHLEPWIQWVLRKICCVHGRHCSNGVTSCFD